jgi:hypothetical protein
MKRPAAAAPETDDEPLAPSKKPAMWFEDIMHQQYMNFTLCHRFCIR